MRAPQERREGLARQRGRDDVGQALLLAEVLYGEDVRVAQLGQRLRPPLEAPEEVGVAGRLLEDRHADRAVEQAAIDRAVGQMRAGRRQALDQLVGAERPPEQPFHPSAPVLSPES